MTTEELLTAIDDLRSDLAEARRYVRTKPATAQQILRDCCASLLAVCAWSGVEMVVLDEELGRLMANLFAGCRCMAAAPNVTEGYIDGSLWELAYLSGQAERGLFAAASATAGEGGGAR